MRTAKEIAEVFAVDHKCNRECCLGDEVIDAIKEGIAEGRRSGLEEVVQMCVDEIARCEDGCSCGPCMATDSLKVDVQALLDPEAGPTTINS